MPLTKTQQELIGKAAARRKAGDTGASIHDNPVDVILFEAEEILKNTSSFQTGSQTPLSLALRRIDKSIAQILAQVKRLSSQERFRDTISEPSDPHVARTVNTLRTFKHTNDQLHRIEEILNE